jgi:hypothetical protein
MNYANHGSPLTLTASDVFTVKRGDCPGDIQSCSVAACPDG